MQTIISKIKERAKKEKKKIVLPESEDVRVLKAASIASLENIAEIILIGDKNKIKEICIKENIDLSELSLQDEEVGNIGWFSREEISDLINNNKFLPPHIEFYDDCINYLDSKN